jgi:hypothetical protein
MAVAACAPALRPGQLPRGPFGRDFPQNSFARFVLDSTSAEEVQAALGPPMKATTVKVLVPATSKSMVPGSPVSSTVLSYYYFPNGVGVPPQAHPGKFAVLRFLNGRLVFYGTNSLIPGEEKPPLDENRLSSLHQCETTKSDVLALLGPPNAEALHVLDAQPGAVEMGYSWSTQESGAVARKTLVVFFDRSGAMTNYRLLNDVTAQNGLPLSTTPTTKLPPACPGHGAREHT